MRICVLSFQNFKRQAFGVVSVQAYLAYACLWRIVLWLYLHTMVKIEVVVHPRSLHPTEAARAYRMRHEEHMMWQKIAESTVNLQ